MATSQLKRSQQKTGSWSTVFPVEQVTVQQSTLFVKKLLAVAISNITYLRTVFPEHAFGDRCLEDLSLKILRDDSACPGACQVIQWVKGCFDALDRKYLRMIVMAIYEDDQQPDTIVESYTFKFTYNDKEDGISIFRNGNKISEAYGPSQTRKATIKLLRTIVVLTQTLRPLPDNVMMTMKLFYYDDITPKEYEPIGFEATNDADFVFANEPMSIKIGDVNTPYHEVKLRIKTDCQQFVLTEEEQQPEISTTGITTDPNFEEQAIEASLSESQTPLNNDPVIVRCPCGYNKDEDLMILCEHCKYWQHAVCFGLRQVSDVPEIHTCETCSKATGAFPCTDVGMSKLTLAELPIYCLWRKALVACLSLNKVIAHLLVKKLNVELSVAQGLLNRLEKEGFIHHSPNGKSRQWKTVLQQVIEQVAIKKYFLHTTDISDQDSTSHQVKIQDESLQQITTGTSSINLQSESASSVKKVHVVEEVRRSPRLAKRARSLMDPTVEFELSNSQDFDSIQESSRKRRKVSVASKAILV